MALPRMLRPSVLIRRKALHAGFLGPSMFWKVVGVIMFGKSTIKKFFGKQPEVIDTASLGTGRVMQLITAKPMTKRRRRAFAKRGIAVPTLAEQRAFGRIWASERAAEKAS